jgi:hypothetical protein
VRLTVRGLVFVGALCLVLGIQAHERHVSGLERLHWSSEELIQTVPLDAIAAEPLRSLLYLHVQPPGLELVRAVLAALPAAAHGGDLLWRVDLYLSFVWALVYAALACLTLSWSRQIVPVRWAAGITALFALHPASLLYATVPDTTLLSALLLAWCTYELWRISPSQGSGVRLACAFVALFLVRSIVQWPALVVFAVALALRGGGKRRLILFLAIATPVVAGYTLKQYLLFGITTTSSFAGYNCVRSLGRLPFGFDRGQLLEPPAAAAALAADPRAARVLSTVVKSSGVQNFNHPTYLAANQLLLDACRREYAASSWSMLASTYRFNASLYLWPSSRYASAQPVLAHVWWRPAFDWILSGARWLILLAVAFGVWLTAQLRQAASAPPEARRREVASRLCKGLGLALPLLMVAATSVLLERGENMRFRYFLEPVVLVFLGAQLPVLGQLARSRAPVTGA